MSKQTFPKRFADKVNITDSCWLWTAGKRKDGYGQYSIGSRKDNSRTPIGAHRYCWEFVNGKIPQDMQVLHKCDTPLCVNPDHLFLGTPKDNMLDKVAKGRGAFGEKNGRSKLTQLQADNIRDLYKQGMYASRKLAKMFDVSPTLILAIINNKNWIKKETCSV